MKLKIALIAAIVFSSSIACAQQDEWKILLDTREVVDIVADGDIIWAATASSGIVKIDTKTKERTYFQQHNSELPDNNVRGLAKSGNTLWIASYSGISSFDGSTWRNFSTANSGLPDDYCLDVLVDRQGTIWVATSTGGIARFDAGANWQVYTTASGLSTNQFVKLGLDSTGNVYALGSKRVSRFDGSTWTVFPQDELLAPAENQFTMAEQFESIAIDKHNNVYAGTSRLAIHKFTGTKWERIAMDHGSDVFALYLYAPVRALAIAPNGDVWAGNMYALVHFNADTVVDIHKRPATTLCIDIPDEKSVWFGGDGVTRYDLLSTFEDFPIEDAQIPGNQIREVLADDFGRIWITSSGGSTRRFDGSQWKRFPMSRGAFSVLPLSLDTTWFVYGINGAGMLAGDAYTDHFALFDTDRFYGTFRASGDNNGGVWFNQRNKLLQENGGEFVTHVSPDYRVFYNANILRFDKNNTLWIGSTYFGLASFDGTTWKLSNNGDLDFASESVYDFDFDSKGLMWCVTADGLLSFDGVTTTLYARSGIGDHMEKSSLAMENDSSFWIGSHDGLWHFNMKEWKHFSKENSPLPDDRIGDIALDNLGNIWIGTSYAGVAIFRPGGINMSAGDSIAEEPCSFVMMPNPATNAIRLDRSYEATSYTLIDQLGRTIRIAKLQRDNFINVHDLANGTYTILIRDLNGTHCKGKFVIDR